MINYIIIHIDVTSCTIIVVDIIRFLHFSNNIHIFHSFHTPFIFSFILSFVQFSLSPSSFLLLFLINNVQGFIDMKAILHVQVDPSLKDKNIFNIVTQDRTYILQANSSDEVEYWYCLLFWLLLLLYLFQFYFILFQF